MEYTEGKARLDRSRSYGEVYGSGQVRYEQDHKEFDARGHELVQAKPGKPKADIKTVAGPADTVEPEPTVEPQDGQDAGIGEVQPEDLPVDEVTMAMLRARYTEVTGGRKAKVGWNKERIAEKIREIVRG